jgi:hypothetical protein
MTTEQMAVIAVIIAMVLIWTYAKHVGYEEGFEEGCKAAISKAINEGWIYGTVNKEGFTLTPQPKNKE